MRGRLIADFESFYTAVDKAEVKLRSFESGAATATKSLNTLADSFSGRKVIQQATLTAEAIERIGGVSKLSTEEAARGLDALDKGMEKMLKTGEMIPTSMMKTAAELRRVKGATDDADQAVGRISSKYREFDGILKLAGVNLDSHVKGLEDLAGLADKASSGLSLLGKAAAVVGAAMAGWKLGERIGEWTGLTEAIGEGTAALVGWGDVAFEELRAREQALELQGHAEKMWKLQKEGTEAATKAAAEHTAEMQRQGMATAGNAAHMESLANQLEAVRLKRVKDAEATRLAAHEQFFFGEKTKETTEVIAKQTVELDKHVEKVMAAKASLDAFMNGPTLNDRVNPTSTFDVTQLTQTELERLNKQYDPHNRGGNYGANQRLKQLEALEGTYAPKNQQQYLQMLKDMLELARLRMTLGGGAPSFASGVENFSGGLAYVHKGEALVNMPKGTSVIPAAAVAAGGGTVVQHFHLSGMVGDKAGLARELKRIGVLGARAAGVRISMGEA